MLSFAFCVFIQSAYPEPMLAQRQRSVAFAGRREERVRDRRNERDGADLAGSTHSFGTAVDDVYFYRRRLVHMWNLELVEVRLDRAPVLERNVRFEGCAQAPDGSALDGVLADLRVERDAAVNHAGDAMNLHQTVCDRQLDHMRDMCAEGFSVGDAAPDALRRALPPSGFFGYRLQHLERALVFEKTPPELIRVGLRSVRQLVNERFDGEDVRPVASRSQHRSRSPDLEQMKIYALVGDFVVRLHQPFQTARVVVFGDRRREDVLQDRRRDDFMRDGRGPS